VNPVAKLPDETREHVVVLLREQRSYRDIVEQTGVALGTISKIARDEGIESPGAAQTEAAANATRIAWAQRRTALVDALGEAAAELLEKTRTAGARDAQAFMTAVAIGVDKAQLLSGGVTSRHEQLDAQRRRDRILAMQDELAERRARKDGTTGG
jgi:transcriptional regulator with XRE-family HTH domain